MMQSIKYWAIRSNKAQAAVTAKGIKATEEQLIKYYGATQKKLIGQFEQIYNKVLSSIEEGKTPTPADLYKLDSYWKMQGQLKEELTKLGDKQAALFSKQFVEQYQNIYDTLALPSGGSYSTISTEAAEQMIKQVWCADGKSWSERIWANTDKLQQTLNDNLIDCLITGKKPTELKHILQEQFGAAYNRADTVVRTEMAHIQTQAAQQRYKESGITEVEVWADEDERRCEQCGKLHKKRYKVTENAPIPAHPRCRCTIIPVVDEKDVEKLAKGSYNNVKSSFDDNVDFNTNQDVKKAIKSKKRIFVTPFTGWEKTPQEYFHNLFGANAAQTPILKGYYDIAAHGTSTSIEIFRTPINSETLAKIIMARKDYKKGTPIRLLSCFTGDDSTGTCFAQELAEMLETEVIAPPFELLISESGRLGKQNKYGKFESVNVEDFRRFKPQL